MASERWTFPDFGHCAQVVTQQRPKMSSVGHVGPGTSIRSRSISVSFATSKRGIAAGRRTSPEFAEGQRNIPGIAMPRIRHCVECPKCRTRYLPSSSPFRNGAYLVPLAENGSGGWILYCSCCNPHAASQWCETELRPFGVSGEAFERGYGSVDEVWEIKSNWHDAPIRSVSARSADRLERRENIG